MSYTNAADIYLGDVSSQIYEFIQRRRPAIFLNSHAGDWQNDPSYEFWKFGPVAGSVPGDGGGAGCALPQSYSFAIAQEEAFNHSISVDPQRSSGERAALAIADYLVRVTG